MNTTGKSLWFLAKPCAQMLGLGALIYPAAVLLYLLTGVELFASYVAAFGFLFCIFCLILGMQLPAAYVPLALSFGATRRSLCRALVVLMPCIALPAQILTVATTAASKVLLPDYFQDGPAPLFMQVGLRPLGGFILMLFLLAAGMVFFYITAASQRGALYVIGAIVYVVPCGGQILVLMLLGYFWPQLLPGYLVALLAAACGLTAYTLHRIRHCSVEI